MLYIKKPIPVEAIKLPDSEEERSVDDWEGYFPSWFKEAVASGRIKYSGLGVYVETLEGLMFAPHGDSYIVKGVDGELYPVRKSIFEKTYEEYSGQE